MPPICCAGWATTSARSPTPRACTLEVAGPATLLVEGDAVKVRRIAQNLLLNALKYTRAGSVTLSWGEAARRRRAPLVR